jgi:hypothetical protein
MPDGGSSGRSTTESSSKGRRAVALHDSESGRSIAMQA